MHRFDLTGHVAVVTGGNRGIGLGLATGLAEAGAAVAIWSRDSSTNASAVESLRTLGAEVDGFSCDVTDEEAVRAAMTATLERFGKVDSLFANAGTSGFIKFPELDDAEWQRMLDVNLTGVMRVTRTVSEHMIQRGEGGSIVLTASLTARFGLPYGPHYSATKGAVLQFGRSLAIRLARYGVRVNVLSPGWVSTEMTSEVEAHASSNEGILARTPMRRWGTPDDFAGPAVFLASRASEFVTGIELSVDGGYSA